MQHGVLGTKVIVPSFLFFELCLYDDFPQSFCMSHNYVTV